MSTRAKIITAVCIVVVFAMAALMYYVPWSTQLDLSLNAVKLDKDGNEIGTAQIRIKGHKLDYLFQDSQLDAEIELADNGVNMYLINGRNAPHAISTYEFNGHQYMQLTGYYYNKQANESTFLRITFTGELDCFVFYFPDDKVYYVGSASGNYDTQGILDYFNTISPTIVPSNPPSGELDWIMTAYQITADGAVENSFSMTISGSILDKDDRPYLSLSINLPDTFRYKFANADPDGDPFMESTAGGDLYALDFTYDRVENAPAACQYAINIEKGYFLAWWGEDFGDYLVAATDPATPPADIMAHFEEYIETDLLPLRYPSAK